MPPKDCSEDILKNGIFLVQDGRKGFEWNGLQSVETFSSDNDLGPSLSETLRTFSPPESFECSFTVQYVNNKFLDKLRYPWRRGHAPLRRRLIEKTSQAILAQRGG